MKRLRRNSEGALSLPSLWLTGLVLAIAGAATAAEAPAQLAPRLVLRPVTPTDITNYKLPSTTQKSAGLANTGVGQPFYLDVLVPKGLVVTNLVWSLDRPATSTAALAASPLGTNVPAYEPSDALVYDVGGRSLLVPDLVGMYSVMATVRTASTNAPFTVGLGMTVANYVGVGSDGASPPQCIACHQDKAAAWQQTGHATKFTRDIDGAEGAYRSSCISCHTVGYDTAATAVNNGFDDVAKQLGWVFPTNSVPGNWAAVPPALKTLANIQCENCHGPGSKHAGVGPMAVSYSTGTCAQCHDAMTHHFKEGEWINSRHAVTTRSPSGPGREGCVKCHTALGFIDTLEGNSPVRTEYVPINCTTCHDPHDATNPHQLRKVADVTLMNGVVVTQGGKGKLCMNCHISRRNAETYVTKYASNFSPHYGTQTDMLAGTNAVAYGLKLPSSAHLYAVKDACVTCHMQEVGGADPIFTHAGGHTFGMAWDRGTADAADDLQMLGVCMECHGPIKSFDFARQDYDGDGITDGVQTEVQHLLDRLLKLLPNNGVPSASYTPAQLKAVYNYLFVQDDGSRGVHNAAYAVAVLKTSIADLTANSTDRDGNGLPDAWETANFGHTGVDPTADADADGVDNRHEYLAGANPNKADTDGDGIDDRTELVMGTNPLDAASAPNVSTKVNFSAAEIEFPSKAGKTYQIQVMSELGASSWADAGAPITGTGKSISVFVPTRPTDKNYYRVVELP
jgi:predicted CXXCH cytochrome family protein